MEMRRILLAEDDSYDIELTLDALAENGVANPVDVVRDGAEALDYLYCRNGFADRDGGPPLVVLLDVRMPKVSGLQVLRQVKEDPGLSLIPVVLLTASQEEQQILEGYRLHANAYVVKPVGFEKFVEAIRHLGMFWMVVNEPPPLAQSGWRA